MVFFSPARSIYTLDCGGNDLHRIQWNFTLVRIQYVPRDVGTLGQRFVGAVQAPFPISRPGQSGLVDSARLEGIPRVTTLRFQLVLEKRTMGTSVYSSEQKTPQKRHCAATGIRWKNQQTRISFSLNSRLLSPWPRTTKTQNHMYELACACWRNDPGIMSPFRTSPLISMTVPKTLRTSWNPNTTLIWHVRWRSICLSFSQTFACEQNIHWKKTHEMSNFFFIPSR